MRRVSGKVVMAGLVLLSAVVALAWGRSYLVADLVHYYRTVSVNALMDYQEGYHFSSGNGGLSFERWTTRFVYSSAQQATQIRQETRLVYDGRFRLNWTEGGKWYGGSLYTPANTPHFMGFAFRAHLAEVPSVADVTVPWAVPLLIVGAYPGWRVWKVWCGRRQFAAGCCRRCGYDLRASEGRCPECGTAIGVDAVKG